MYSQDTDWGAVLNEKFRRLEADSFRALCDDVAAKALERGLWIEEGGERRPISLMLRPRLFDLSCRGYLHHVTWQIRMGLRRTVRLAAADERAAELLPLGDEQREWFERYHLKSDSPSRTNGGPRLFCRLDALVRFDGPGWRETLKFMETNAIGTGGLTYAPIADNLVLEEVLPTLFGDDDEFACDRNTDPRDLLIDELIQHARSRRVRGIPTVALIDDKSLYRFGGEFGRLMPYLEQTSRLHAVYADPRELDVAQNGDVVHEGNRIDLCYRFLDLAELAAMEKTHGPLMGIRKAFENGIVVPTPGGDLEHKSVFELLTSPEFESAFDDEQRRVFREHVLWTRLCFERKTTDPDGGLVDLPEYVRSHREALVLKPNTACGGEGVIIGATVTQADWESRLAEAMGRPKSHVVQLASEPDAKDLPYLENGELVFQKTHCAAGFFPSRTGMAVFGRYSTNRVVNIQQGGGIVPFLVNVR